MAPIASIGDHRGLPRSTEVGGGLRTSIGIHRCPSESVRLALSWLMRHSQARAKSVPPEADPLPRGLTDLCASSRIPDGKEQRQCHVFYLCWVPGDK